MLQPACDTNQGSDLKTNHHTATGPRPYALRKELFRWRIFVSTGLLVPLAGVVVALIRLWRIGPMWSDFVAFGVMYILTLIGVSVGYHRLFTHRSFVPARWLELTLAVLGSMSLIGPLAIWVATHRRHHAFADRDGDPHSPYHPHADLPRTLFRRCRGFFHGYVGWLYTPDYSPLERWTPDLLKDSALMAINDRFLAIALISVLAPGLVTFAVTRTLQGFIGGLLWGGLVRICIGMHNILLVNTVCHVLGERPYDSPDSSRNLWPIALISFGECWHNNHHASPSAAIYSTNPWQIDIGGMAIRLFEVCGFARDVKRVPLKARRSEI